MGFLDNIKQGADKMASSVNKAVSGTQSPAGQVPGQPAAPIVPSESYFHDLGVLVYQQQTGRATEQTESEVERVVAGLQENEQMGRPTSFHLKTAPPPAPGAAASPPPPGGAPVAAPPPPGGAPVAAPPPPGGAPASPEAPVAPPPPPGAVAPPPPPGTVGGATGDGAQST